jgi:uncharacterized membrane protein
MEPRLQELERRLTALDERLASVETLLRGVLQSPRAPVDRAEPPSRPEPAPAPASAPHSPPQPPPPPPPAVRDAVSFEDLLGGRVLAWLGGVAVVLGVVFFLVMAARRGWIDEPTRVLLALTGSAALLGASLYLHERQGRTQAALAAAATAIAALYVTLLAATQLYDLVDAALGLLFAGLVGATATAIAVRWGEPVVAGVGILGALLAPVLVDAPTGGVTLAFMAVALASAVAILLWQRWSWLAASAFAISVPQLLAWLDDTYGDELAVALAVLVAFWLLYVVAAIGYELRVPITTLRLSSAGLLLANAALIAGVGWAMLDETGHGAAATAWVLATAAVHIGGGVPAYRGHMSREIAALVVAIGTALAAVGLALALDGPVLVAGWAAEAIVLAWAARRLGDPRGHLVALVFFVLAGVHVLAVEAPPDGLRTPVPDFARAAAGIAIVGVAAVALAWLARGVDLDRALDVDVGADRLYLAVAAVAAVYLPSLGIVAAFGRDELEPDQTAQVLLSAFWAVTGLAGIVVGLLRDVRVLRLGALGLLGLAVVKVFVYDLSELESLYRALSFIALGLLLLGGAFAYQRLRRGVAE